MRLGLWIWRNRLSQVEFARLAGCRQQVVSRWSAGLAIPSPVWIHTIERVTNGEVGPADWYAFHRVVEGVALIPEAEAVRLLDDPIARAEAFPTEDPEHVVAALRYRLDIPKAYAPAAA